MAMYPKPPAPKKSTSVKKTAPQSKNPVGDYQKSLKESSYNRKETKGLYQYNKNKDIVPLKRTGFGATTPMKNQNKKEALTEARQQRKPSEGKQYSYSNRGSATRMGPTGMGASKPATEVPMAKLTPQERRMQERNRMARQKRSKKK